MGPKIKQRDNAAEDRDGGQVNSESQIQRPTKG